MYISLFKITPDEVKAVNLGDRYRVHQFLFQKYFAYSMQREFLFKIKTFDKKDGLSVFVTSKDAPTPGSHLVKATQVPEAYLAYKKYKVHMHVNPTVKSKGKLHGITDHKLIEEWFTRKGVEGGFAVTPGTFVIQSAHNTKFFKAGVPCTLVNVTITALIDILDTVKFTSTMEAGIGRGRAFGFGLIEASPVR